MTEKEFKQALKLIDKNISLLKKERKKLCNKFDKELHKQWKKLMRRIDINDVDSEWKPIITNLT